MWIQTECAETSNDCHTLLFASRSSWHAHLFRSIFFRFLCFQNTLAATSLAFLLVLAGRILWTCIVDFHFGKFIGQILFEPCLAPFVVWIVFTVLKNKWENCVSMSSSRNREFSSFLPRWASYNFHSIALLSDKKHLLSVHFWDALKFLSFWGWF